MDVRIGPNTGIVRVTLSKRNLVTLLNNIDESESARTLFRRNSEGVLIVVTAETDEEHYKRRGSSVHAKRTDAVDP